jgi:hypothetical protein
VDVLITPKNLHSVFGFFIASFSRERDDLAQWRAYGDNGRGFSLGLAPHLFQVEDKADTQSHEHVFLVPVVYGKQDARSHLMPAIEKAVHIIMDETVKQVTDLMQDRCEQFLDEMATNLIASQMILNILTVKHEAYQQEKEVRLFKVVGHRNLAPHVFHARPTWRYCSFHQELYAHSGEGRHCRNRGKGLGDRPCQDPLVIELQRLDYVAVGPAAHYCFDHTAFGGLVFPTLRRVDRPPPSGPLVNGPTAVLIQITRVKAHSQNSG